MVSGWRRVAWEMRMARGAGNEMRGGDCQDGMGGLCRSAMCLKQAAEMGPCRMGGAGTGTGGIQTAYGTEYSGGLTSRKIIISHVRPALRLSCARAASPRDGEQQCPDAIAGVMPQTFTGNEALWCRAQSGLGLTSTRLGSRATRPPFAPGTPLPPAWSSRVPAGSAQPYSSLPPSPARERKRRKKMP